MKKFPYQRGSKKNINDNTLYIKERKLLLTIPKENVFLKALELEASLWELANDEEEALRIAELLVARFKNPFL